jgi:hypothetical protein
MYGTRHTLKLTPQHLGEVVNALGITPTGAGSEKRRAARMEIEGSVVVAPFNSDGAVGAPFTAVTRDISFVGVGLLLGKQLWQGQPVVVRLPRGQKPALSVICRVMHVRLLADGLFAVGVEYVRVTEAQADAPAAHADPVQLQPQPRPHSVVLN